MHQIFYSIHICASHYDMIVHAIAFLVSDDLEGHNFSSKKPFQISRKMCFVLWVILSYLPFCPIPLAGRSSVGSTT